MIEDGSSVTFAYVSVPTPVLPTKLQIIGTRRRGAQTEKQTEGGCRERKLDRRTRRIRNTDINFH